MGITCIGGKIYFEDVPKEGPVPNVQGVVYRISGVYTRYFDKKGRELVRGGTGYTLKSKFCSTCGVSKQALGYHKDCNE